MQCHNGRQTLLSRHCSDCHGMSLFRISNAVMAVRKQRVKWILCPEGGAIGTELRDEHIGDDDIDSSGICTPLIADTGACNVLIAERNPAHPI